jgi:FHA domain-containing protein
MLRVAVEGIHSLVAMRAAAKGQMQADMTMISVRGNNPLKFAPDAKVALRMLLQPPARGFLDGPAALHAALIDVQSHEVGVVAGMRAALEAVLDRFAPEKLEAQLATRSVFDSVLPAHRRARLWELYMEHYRSLRGEAQQDFQRLFGAAFNEAYLAQVRSLEADAPDQ